MADLLYEDIQRQLAQRQKALENPDAFKCSKCSSSFFETVVYSEYKLGATSVIGQQPPTLPNSPTFFLLRCLCGEVYEPSVYTPQQDLVSKKYENFVALAEKVHK
jgi:hypothetical protein